MKTQIQRFQAALEKGDRALGWTIARVPFEPSAVWAGMVRLRVKGTVEGFEFRSSLFPCSGLPGEAGAGGFYLLVNKAVQTGSGARLGRIAAFTLEPDLDARPAELPDELAVLLDDEPALREWYDALSEYTRRELGKWVLGVKSDEARMRRAQQTAERLLATMEAEVELPPLIANALKRNAKASAGWETMTAAQKRAELMGVFYYQTPESRANRVGKLCEVAAKRISLS